MKSIFTLVLASLFFSVSAFNPKVHQQADRVPISGLDDVINSLKSGNATELAKYVDDNIEIALPDKSDTYSRAQAVVILQDFFTNNGVKGFEIVHKGDNGGSQFCIGTLQTRSGNYRTIVFMKTKNGKQLVKQIKFQSI
ncbi:MAG TPA: DUF4783 domain-containing protein [Flavisolibacter sp.]|jgi:hypothetical protein|nr:DUF4783 domain-containing protein [Flavisolibacter sp.]